MKKMGRQHLLRLGKSSVADFNPLIEAKSLEQVFIWVRWFGVLTIFLMAWLHTPLSRSVMVGTGIFVALCNGIAMLLNQRIKTPDSQKALGRAMFALDALAAWVVLSLFMDEFYTSGYAGFALVIIEGAIRYGLRGSMAMWLVFVVGLLAVMILRLVLFDVRFSSSGYAFWTSLMGLIALGVGWAVREGRRYRRENERFLEERTKLLERQRLSFELHDSVLKTLHGLALEARALQNSALQVPEDIKQRARYIEEVCSQTGQEIRKIILDLYHGEVRERIGSRLKKMAEEWSRQTGISTTFLMAGQDRGISGEIGHNLCCILGEALSNIEQHASASRVRISLNVSSERVNLEVSDNGKGLKSDEIWASTAAGKLGIAGMRERVERLGGRFSVRGGRGGTWLSVTVPLGREEGWSESPSSSWTTTR